MVDLYREKKTLFQFFQRNVESVFQNDTGLNTGIPTIIHSIRSRLKDEQHLADKIRRKHEEGRDITTENLFREITDFAGVRVLHLHQAQFDRIHSFIKGKVKSKVWRFREPPVAYTWDPESQVYFRKLKIKTELKPSYYTSVHYLVSPANEDGDSISCEIQVRTLFEEAWGEIDHSINYPNKTAKLANIEQLRVLSKLVSTGSRLADSIFKVHEAP